jgi:hypothetical protein
VYFLLLCPSANNLTVLLCYFPHLPDGLERKVKNGFHIEGLHKSVMRAWSLTTKRRTGLDELPEARRISCKHSVDDEWEKLVWTPQAVQARQIHMDTTLLWTLQAAWAKPIQAGTTLATN